MPSIIANGITLEYEVFGDRSRRPLLLIMGLGGQLIAWDPAFIEALVERDFFVVTFDNRDVGKSQWFDDAGLPDVVSAMSGRAQSAYLIGDMADDAAGLLDALNIESAHVMGISMGGMIAQSLAIRHPGRVKTVTSIMSTTGDRSVGAPKPDAVQALLMPPPQDRAAAIDHAVVVSRIISSPGFPFDEDHVRDRAAAAYDRAFHPQGTARQLVAILASEDRTEQLRKLDVPGLVIHGADDPLVDMSGGKATAAAIPGAQLKIVPGMGHDLPRALYKEFADDIAAVAQR
jgi:pimeloyl-ACP methyl ester carboxylesterase